MKPVTVAVVVLCIVAGSQLNFHGDEVIAAVAADVAEPCVMGRDFPWSSSEPYFKGHLFYRRERSRFATARVYFVERMWCAENDFSCFVFCLRGGHIQLACRMNQNKI